MEIPRELRPLESPARRRAAEPTRARDEPAVAGDGAAAEAGDSAALSLSRDQVARYVAEISAQAPERLHRVDELRARIADGSYSADSDELAGPLLDLLGG